MQEHRRQRWTLPCGQREAAARPRAVQYRFICIYRASFSPRRRPQHSVRRLPGSGQVQCTSWRNFAPFSSSTFKNIHGEQAGKRTKRLPLESLARGCSGSRFFCVPGHAVQGRRSRDIYMYISMCTCVCVCVCVCVYHETCIHVISICVYIDLS
jgi:hypothetical protein